jgi:hypothetical protein
VTDGPGIVATFAIKCFVDDVKKAKDFNEGGRHEFARELRVIDTGRLALRAADFAV